MSVRTGRPAFQRHWTLTAGRYRHSDGEPLDLRRAPVDSLVDRLRGE